MTRSVNSVSNSLLLSTMARLAEFVLQSKGPQVMVTCTVLFEIAFRLSGCHAFSCRAVSPIVSKTEH